MADHALTTTIEISGVITPGLQKAMASAAADLQKISSESLQAAGKAEKLTTEIRQQESELKQLEKAYADYVLSGQEGSEEAMQLAQNIQSLSSELGENKGDLEAAFSAAEKLASGMDQTGTEAQQLERAISQQEKTLQQLKEKYTSLQLSEDDTTDESRQLAQQIDKLSSELQENKGKLSAAKAAADQLDHTLEETDDAARRAEEGFSVFKGTLANLAADAIRSAWQGLKNLGSSILETGMEFESSMSEVASISGATGTDLQRLENTAQKFGATTVFSASEAADALKYMSLAGWDVNQSTSALGGVLNLAAASGMELGAASDMVTDYLSAFGMKASQSAYFADMLAYAQANSNTTAEDLGAAYKNCAANLNAAGQDIETTTSLLQVMADQGTKAEKAGTSLSAMMRDITKKMQDGSIKIGDTSIAVQDAQGNFRDLTDILRDVEAATDGMGTAERSAALSSTFTADSIRGVNQILNVGVDKASAYEEALRGSAGAAAEMAEKANDNLAGDLKEMHSAIDALKWDIYKGLQPALRGSVQFVTGSVIPAVRWVGSHLPELGVIITALAAVIAKAKWGAIVEKIGFLKKGITGAMTALSGIGAPALAVIGVIAALALAFMHLWKTNEGFRDRVTLIWLELKDTFLAFSQGIVDRLNALGFNFESIADVIKAVWSTVCAILAPLFENAFSAIASILSGALTVLTGLFDVFSGIFTGDWSLTWQGIKEIFSGVWTAIKGIFSGALGFIKSIASGAWNAIKGVTVSVWNSITSTISAKLAAAKAAVSSVFNTIRSTISSVLSGALAKVQGIFSSIYTAISSKINAAKSVVSSAISAIKNAMHFSWSLPRLKLPHFSVSGKFSLNPPSAPKFGISWYKEGGILTQPTAFGAIGNNILAGGEAGAEAVLPLSKLWSQLDKILNSAISTVASISARETLTAKAGQLVANDNFSLGSLGGSITYINYDVGGVYWSPTINNSGDSLGSDDFMRKVKEHEAEFMDWLEEFAAMRDAAMYA